MSVENKVLLGTYNTACRTGDVFLVGDKANLEKLIAAGCDKNSRMYFEYENPIRGEGVNLDDFITRCLTVSVNDTVGYLEDFTVVELDQISEYSQDNKLEVYAKCQFIKPDYTPSKDFSIRCLSKQTITAGADADIFNVTHIITWDQYQCQKEYQKENS